jgi:putative transcriptional regulator
MEDELFNELVESVKEGVAYLRGEADPAVPHFAGEPDPREIRARMGLTQEEFAETLYISVKTLRNWEQGRREPSGPAMRLLQIAAKHPEVLIEAAKLRHRNV